ncbi:MAG: PIN domain-containing protein [Paracoccaceae bacterium]
MKAVLDACVLYPTVLREVLLATAGAGLFAPLWSARILEEWARVGARHGPVGEALSRGEIAAMTHNWPDASIGIASDPVVALPDPADRHVVAAALDGGAETIVTLNLRDFPPRALAPFGLRAEHPDAFLYGLWRQDPGTVAQAAETVRARAEALSGQAQPMRALLKRAYLPRLGKAVSQMNEAG